MVCEVQVTNNIVGHVDAGKSTLMGRLMQDLKAVDTRTVEKYRKEAEAIGKGSFALAWVMDSGSDEREHGVTIDYATNRFDTDRTAYTILDAPGHRDFVPNMIAGASQADFAVLVVDATPSSFEAGLKPNGQTKEHSLLIRSMGVQRIIIAVNKMDSNSVQWSRDRFEEIETQLRAFLSSTVGFQEKFISVIPCSGLQGDNILERAKDPRAQWHKGNTLVEELETVEMNTHAIDKPLRMTIADVFRGGIQNPLSIAGRLDSGCIQVGDAILSMPVSESATIKAIEIDQKPQDWAVAGDNVVLHLVGPDPVQHQLRLGDIVCSATSPARNVDKFHAKVLAFDHLLPMLVDVFRGRTNIPGRISKLVEVLPTKTTTAGPVVVKKPKIVAPSNVARVEIELEEAVPMEAGARIVLRSRWNTVAAGLVE